MQGQREITGYQKLPPVSFSLRLNVDPGMQDLSTLSWQDTISPTWKLVTQVSSS